MIGTLAAIPMIDNNNEPASENLPSPEDLMVSSNNVMGSWTHSSICQWKSMIQCNAKPELTFWTLSLSDPYNLNLFKGLFFSLFIKKTILPQMNKKPSPGGKPILHGEFLHWIGLWMLMGTLVSPQRHEFWATHPIDAFNGVPFIWACGCIEIGLMPSCHHFPSLMLLHQCSWTNFWKYDKWLRCGGKT